MLNCLVCAQFQYGDSLKLGMMMIIMIMMMVIMKMMTKFLMTMTCVTTGALQYGDWIITHPSAAFACTTLIIIIVIIFFIIIIIMIIMIIIMMIFMMMIITRMIINIEIGVHQTNALARAREHDS